MLRHMKLTNFRSWQSLDIDLAPITVLFGANNSGKSNILSALLLLKQTRSRPEPINLGGSDLDLVDFGSYRELVYGNDEEGDVSISIRWDEVKHDSGMMLAGFLQQAGLVPTYQVVWGKHDDSIHVEQLHYQFGFGSDAAWTAERQEDGEYALRSHATGQSLLAGVESCFLIHPKPTEVSNVNDTTSLKALPAAFANLMDDIYYLGPIRKTPDERIYLFRDVTPQQIGKQGENAIAALIASERQTASNGHEAGVSLLHQVREWLVKMEIASDFQLQPFGDDQHYRLSIRTPMNNSEGALADVGFGVSQVLPVITLLFFAKPGSTLLLEEPELHLHPRAQSHLADLILDVAEKRNLQLIVESHSEHLLRRLQRRIAESA